MAKQLDNKAFIRVHKSTIVNFNKVASFKSRLNGDYDIFLKNGVKLRLSRTYVANFKSNFKNGNRVTT
ncbi:LytTR family DNA-binding domain-containing protein [Aureibaculum algae]|uniref:LytTR family DNA-binding domain-containing protein n=1 Tax=Aureibaculum algae TaxID=2584122 RepID=UPI00202A00F5|nr:LytTR family DNA-binding domain-containing protein [Aureibaculum algae]